MSDAASDKTEEALLRNQAFLKSLALSLLGDEHLADDVVQSTWVAALEAEPKVQNWRAWTGRVVRNLSQKVRRGSQRRETHESAVPFQVGEPPADQTLEQEEILRSVTDAVLALEQPYRGVVLMRYFEGLRPKEIAARTSRPVATIKSQLQRGLRMLRQQLDRHSDRRAWGASLAALVGERPMVIAPASATTGVIAMSMKSKFSFAALALVFLLGGMILLTDGNSEHVAPLPSLALEPIILGNESLEAEAGANDDVAQDQSSIRIPVDVDRSGSIDLKVRYANSDPANGVGVKVTAFGDPHAQLRSFRKHTDEHGELHLEGLHPGRITLTTDRGGFRHVELEPGGHATASLTIPLGIDITGRVIDNDGLPIADAEIWLSAYGNDSEGGRATIADSTGRFLLRSVGTGRNVMARKHGYGQSKSHIAEGSKGDAHELTLTMPRLGASMRVLVEDTSGIPVPGARVRIVTPGDRGQRPNPKGWTSYFKPIDYVLTTEDDGTCIAESLSPGTVRIIVNGINYAPWERDQKLSAGENTVRVQISRGASVAGLVTMSTGEPVMGATLRVGRDWRDSSRKTQTGPDGQYRIDGLSIGEFLILAMAADQGEVNAILVGSADTVIEWNPILDPGLVLHGRVIDEAGQGIAGWSLKVEIVNSVARFTRTDANGSFRMINCPEENLFVELTNPRQRTLFAISAYGPIRAGGEPLELVVLDRDRQKTASLFGRVLAKNGEPIAARIVLNSFPNDAGVGWTNRSNRWHMLFSDHSSGQFKIDALDPGSYTIAITSEQGSYDSGKLDLLPSEERDLGDLQVDGPGELKIDLHTENPTQLEHMKVSIDPQNSFLFSSQVPATQANAIQESYQLPAGVWIVRVFGNKIVTENHFIKIESGETQQLSLAPRTGAYVSLSVRSREDLPSQVIRVRVFSATGEQVAEQIDLIGGQSQLAGIYVPPADSYRVLVELRDGRMGEARIDRSAQWLPLSGDAPRPAAVEILIR